MSVLSVLSIGAVSKDVIVDTGQVDCYNNYRQTACPKAGEAFFGQDAEYVGHAPSYKDNGDGTVTDINTGLMWSKGVDREKLSLVEAKEQAKQMRLAGHSDWRVPTIKELYTLIDFRGYTGSKMGNYYDVPKDAVPFIDTDYFDFLYGDTSQGERYIDAQWLSSTEYVSTTMMGAKTLFGVNFADGRIKGYGYSHPRGGREKKFYVRYVRGDTYGDNQLIDNKDGTVTDDATGYMWMKDDSQKAMDWEKALAYCENLKTAGHDDWRLPNAKELQYIVDYSRSPDTTNGAAIDPVFNISSITNEEGRRDYPFFWTSTTHLEGERAGTNAVYITFGRALGKMRGQVMDVHGAGAQRSDPKSGQSTFRGPQGDVVRSSNYVRCVRGGDVKLDTEQRSSDKNAYPGKFTTVQKSGNGVSEQKMPPIGGKTGFINRLDQNGDGKISPDEFDGPVQGFRHFDKNGDGYISADEAPSGPPPKPPMR